MMSKTVLACLAVLATMSMASGNLSSDANFGYCVTGVSYINQKFSLGFAIDQILGGVLNLVGNIVRGLFGVVNGLLSGIGLGGNNNIPFIAAPNNIQNFAGVFVKVGPIFGKLLAPSFGAGFDANIFADVHGALSLNLFNILRLDIGSASYLRNAVSLDIARQKAAQISAFLNSNNFKSGQWATVAALINDYLNVVVSQKQIDVDLYVAATLKYIRIQAALLKMAGFPSVNEYVSSMVQTCNSVFSQIGYARTISTSDIVVDNVPSNCNCFAY